MNPTYTLFIDVGLTKPIASETIWMRAVVRLPFKPIKGDTLRLTDTDENSTFDITLDEVCYDMNEGTFIADINDSAMVDQYSEDGTLGEREVVDKYKSFGFTRLNFPQGQGRT